MTHDDAAWPWRGGGLAIAAIVLLCLAVNAVLLWRWSGIDEKATPTPALVATKAEVREEASAQSREAPPPTLTAPVEPSESLRRSPQAFGRNHAAAPIPDRIEVREPEAPTQRPAPAVRPAVVDRAEAVTERKTPVAPGSASDRTPPVLQMLRFDPPVVEGGGTTTLTVQASDALSGVKSFKGEIRSPNGLATLSFRSQHTGGDTLTYTLTIPGEAQSGTWYVSWISVADGADNNLLIQAPSAAAAPQGGTLVVSSSESDSAAPEVVRIWLDKTTVDGGENSVIKVEARDDGSGVASVLGACQSSSKSAFIWFSCTATAEPGVWEGDVRIPKNAECGSWQVQQLTVKDKAGNTTLLSGDSPVLANAGFQVSNGTDCDTQPPSLDTLELSPTSVSGDPAPEIVVTATVYDAGSGTTSVTGWLEGPVSEGGQAPKIQFRCAPDPTDPGAPWIGVVQLPRFATKGTWRIGYLRLEDKAHNFREHGPADPVISSRVVELQ